VLLGLAATGPVEPLSLLKARTAGHESQAS
jgi:hypothetical protein